MTSLSLSRQSVSQLAATLGLSAPFASRVSKRLEPKFSSLLNSLKKNALEEAIVSFLVVLSPQNLLLPPSSQPLQGLKLSLPDLPPKKGDGLLVTSRLLMALCEPVVDENKRFFIALAIKEEDPLSMAAWLAPPESKRKGGIGSHMTARDRRLMYMRAVRPAARMMSCMKPSEDDVEDKRLASLLKHAYLWDVGKYDPVKAVEDDKERRLTVEQLQRLAKGETLAELLPPAAPVAAQSKKDSFASRALLNTAVASLQRSLADLFALPPQPNQSPRAYLSELTFPMRRNWPADVLAARQQVLASYNIALETHLFLVWMLTENALLERLEISSMVDYIAFLLAPHLGAQDTLKLNKPRGWRATLPQSARYGVMAIINNFFVVRGFSREMKAFGEAAYNNELRIYEMAFMCLCCQETEYMDRRRLETMLPLIMPKFQSFVGQRLELQVADILTASSRKDAAVDVATANLDAAGQQEGGDGTVLEDRS
eukprot:gene37450-45479_t